MEKIMITPEFNKFLDGGFESGIINNICGPAGSGKTLISMLAAINVVDKGKRVIYIDTEGGFSVDRFSQLVDNVEYYLDKIIFLKPNNFEEQKEAFKKIKGVINEEIGIIIVDSISMLYRLELGRGDQVYNANRELGLQVSFLNEIARKQNLCVLFTSHIYSDFDNKDKIKMVGGDFLKYSSKCLIELQNLENSVRSAQIIRHRSLENNEFLFKIVQKGIELIKKN